MLYRFIVSVHDSHPISCCVDAERDDAEHIELTAYAGADVWLNCTYSSTVGTDVEWWYQRQSVRHSVYRNGIITDDFQQQFTALKHGDEDYSLVISNANVNNSGTYECVEEKGQGRTCLLYTSPSPRDRTRSRMPSSA